MAKLIAVLNVMAWSGFWAFGYLALMAAGESESQTAIALLLAAAGGGVGMVCYLWLVRHSEATGYAKPRNRGIQTFDDGGQA